MAVQWWQHGVCVVCAQQTRFANGIIDDLMRSVYGGWLQNKHAETVHYRCGFGVTALDDDRSGGRVDGMEWCGLG